MKNTINSLQDEYFVLADLIIEWNLTIDQIIKAACEGKIKIGLISNGWVVQAVTKELTLFDYTSDIYNNDEIGDFFKNKYEENLIGDKKGVIQVPFSLLPEDLITLRSNGLLKTFFVRAFDTDDYFLVHSRSNKDLRYRNSTGDQLTFTTDDIKNLIITRAEKDKCEREYGLGPIEEESLTGDKDFNTSATIGLLIHIICEKMPGYKKPSGPNYSQIAQMIEDEFQRWCEKEDYKTPRGFGKRILETRLKQGMEHLGKIMAKENF